jgi:hypothetical protein
MLKCFFIEPTGQTRSLQFRGPAATPILERLYRCNETGYVRWEQDHIPGYNFGPGAMFFQKIWDQDCLMLVYEHGHYINLDGPVSTCSWLIKKNHKCRTRVGIPPMITVTHHCQYAPMIWTLENGTFEAKNGNWNHIIQIPDRTEA